MYLEGGLVPARYIIMGNLVNFLHYILKEDSESLLLTMLKAQIEHPTKNDWNSEIKSILAQISLELKYEEIKVIKETTFKKMVRKKH